LNIYKGCRSKNEYESKELGEEGLAGHPEKKIGSGWKQVRTLAGSARYIEAVMSPSLAVRDWGFLMGVLLCRAEDAQPQGVVAESNYWFLKVLSRPRTILVGDSPKGEHW
jgi:hypothetical protein